MVLRWSGSDNGPELVSLDEAVTAVRVRVECGLLIEAFMYQRSVCTKVKKKKARHELSDGFNELINDFEDGLNWLEILVTEICLLCIRRKLVDRIIGLPWNVDEEKHLHKCLLDYAMEEPLINTGSLLVVFYLQRYRYVEAYQVDQELQSLEKNFISNNLVDDDVKIRMVTTQHWRAGLVNKNIQLLPEVEQEKVKSGQMTKLTPPEIDNNDPENPNPDLIDSNILVPSYVNSSLIFQMDDRNPSPKSNFGGLTNYSTVSQVNKFGDTERGMSMLKSISKNFKFDDIITTSTTPLKEFNRGSSRIQKNKYLQNESVDHLPNYSPYFGNIPATLEDSPGGINGLFNSKVSGKSARLSRHGRYADVEASADLMDMTWSNKDERLPVQTNVNGGPRWRSDDSTAYEDQHSPDRLTSGASFNSPTRGLRRSRRTRR
ncbi:hypothetical protein L1987_56378 [Smallanthus sonchifolius]|uniref:Uncharacterized protein n=1 Tax=Smallanthus sonchifolius TaxID=185202 RepID=A0ACB9ECK8_9ASTR|nr:hypothetical protein L1987_56378 [Smallanthus sonchifolius]